LFEREVVIHELGAQQVQVSLGATDQAVFSGCPEAVEPYLLGDYKAASKALDRAGLSEVANWIRAEFHKERGETKEAARFYQAAGHLTQAAELTAQSEDAGHSASMFEQAGDFRRAAESYKGAGEHLKAAKAFEAAFDFDSAIEAYRAAGEREKVMELYERIGRYFDAGQSAMQAGDTERAIRNLQMVDLRDPDFADACQTLAQLFAKQGEWDLAIEKAREAVNLAGEDAASLELLEQLGTLLEKGGRSQEALAVYEGIRKRDFNYEGMAERVQALRQVVASQSQASTHVGAAPAPRAAAPAEDRYEVIEEIGRGGMGVVFKARDRRLGRVVALKKLPDNLRDHPTAVELFLREARAAAALNHPNIVTLFDADHDANGNYYITMEFLEGFPLDKALKKRGKFSLRDGLRIAAQIATGLQYAHDQRIVHRDIKTANLFFTRDRLVKIMDFGLAKMMEEVRKGATVVGGTPYYMPPEQAAGEAIDHRADLYAFGVTLFEMLTGSVPFQEGDVLHHHRHTPVPDPRTLAPELPEAVALLIQQLMAKRPEDRPATTAEVAARIERILRGA
jgi:tRNA A-37 threonylcarbamoyl transferase component Bud32